MKIELNVKPKNAILVEGFPGFGLIGTIVTEFLIEHLGAKSIGKIHTDDLPPIVAVHNSKIIEPLEVYYDKKTNIVILHALTGVTGLEWKLANIVKDLCKELKVKELICVEGVSSPTMGEELKTFYVAENNKKLQESGVEELKEGMIVGVTGALMLNVKDVKKSCIFVETKSNFPDSRGAAKVIEVLDNYLGLKVDYKPLIKKAAEFEDKIRGLMNKSKQALEHKQVKEDLNYLG